MPFCPPLVSLWFLPFAEKGGFGASLSFASGTRFRHFDPGIAVKHGSEVPNPGIPKKGVGVTSYFSNVARPS